ncbi:MAG: NAD(P)/FAD-dependent oxidoreductase [Candidatus Bathyarchaeota archaeon]|nr:NAD(P)/FAD-dependent oxidoreductase [Candidatus Bathyarchaeota archaeon]
MSDNLNFYDTVIIGGGPAGISAAMHLVFHHRKIIIVDRQTSPMNFYTNPVRNYLGVRPLAAGVGILRKMRNEVKESGVTVAVQNVVDIQGEFPEFEVHVEPVAGEKRNTILNAKTLVFATGVARKHPLVNGDWRGWLPFAGKDNISYYCPDCEGPLTFGKDVLVVNAGTVNSALHVARQIRPFARRVRIFMTDDAYSPFLAQYREILEESEFEWSNGVIERVIVQEPGEHQQLVTTRGEILQCNHFFVALIAVPRSELAVKIGVEVDKRGNIITDHRGKTSVEGVWAAGDVRPITQSIAMAVGTGNYAGIMINQFLLQ